jgi:hypothetical protein
MQTLINNDLPPQPSYKHEEHIAIISDLKNQFFQPFQTPFHCSICSSHFIFAKIDAERFLTCFMKHFEEDNAAAEMDLVDFQSDFSSRSRTSRNENI